MPVQFTGGGSAGSGGSGVTDGDKGDITVTGAGAVWTIDINTVSNTKAADMAANSIKGNNTGGVGDPVDLTVAQTKTLLSYTAGDVGADPVGSAAAAQAASQPLDGTLTAVAGLNVTAGLVEQTGADAFTKRALGVGASTSVPTRADADTRYAALSHVHAAADTTSGVFPISLLATGTPTGTKFIRDDGTLAVPAGVTDGDKGDITVSGSGATWTIDADAVTYAQIQNVSATDRILGRSTAGAGDVQEIVCTTAGRGLIDDPDAPTQRSTLGMGTISNVSFRSLTLNTVAATVALIPKGAASQTADLQQWQDSAATVLAAITAGGSLQLAEITAPAAPATNNVRIYAEDNGSGKTRLMALFPTGAAVQIAIEP